MTVRSGLALAMLGVLAGCDAGSTNTAKEANSTAVAEAAATSQGAFSAALVGSSQPCFQASSDAGDAVVLAVELATPRTAEKMKAALLAVINRCQQAERELQDLRAPDAEGQSILADCSKAASARLMAIREFIADPPAIEIMRAALNAQDACQNEWADKYEPEAAAALSQPDRVARR